MGGMSGIGRILKDAGRLASKKRKPPKKFDAMTEGRKVSQAKKRLKMKTRKEAALAEIGRIMNKAGITQKGADYNTGTSMSKADINVEKDKISNKKKKKNRTTPNQLAKGGGKIYASTDKKYGGGIFPRKGKM